ncbi:DUF2252 family protein [Photobacterium sp. R1]
MISRQSILSTQLSLTDGVAPSPVKTLDKHIKMTLNPYQFYRGSAQLFYADLATGILTLPDMLLASPGKTIIMGDCHLANFGFLTEEGSHGDQVIFSPNDFDDACVGYGIWDLARFLISLSLAGDLGRGLLIGQYLTDEIEITDDLKSIQEDDVKAACKTFLSAYRNTLKRILKDENVRYQVLKKFDHDHVLNACCRKAAKRAAGGDDFYTKSQLAKSTIFEDGKLRFTENPFKYKRLHEKDYLALETTFRPYLDDEILDIVARLGAGIGANHAERYYFLVGPAELHDIHDLSLCHIVEVKQQCPASPTLAFPDVSPVNTLNPAHLAANCQRQLQRRPDLLLDEVVWRKKQWLVRSRHHARLSVKPESLILQKKHPGEAFCQYANACGIALALAHSRGDRRSVRFEHFMVELLPEHDKALTDACLEYSEQVIQDHALLCDIIRL